MSSGWQSNAPQREAVAGRIELPGIYYIKDSIYSFQKGEKEVYFNSSSTVMDNPSKIPHFTGAEKGYMAGVASCSYW